MSRLYLNKQFYFGLFVIAGLTLLTISITNQTAQQLHKAYQLATSDFIPLMQTSNKLQSKVANLNQHYST
jgi:hypothetical protein